MVVFFICNKRFIIIYIYYALNVLQCRKYYVILHFEITQIFTEYGF